MDPLSAGDWQRHSRSLPHLAAVSEFQPWLGDQSAWGSGPTGAFDSSCGWAHWSRRRRRRRGSGTGRPTRCRAGHRSTRPSRWWTRSSHGLEAVGGGCATVADDGVESFECLGQIKEEKEEEEVGSQAGQEEEEAVREFELIEQQQQPFKIPIVLNQQFQLQEENCSLESRWSRSESQLPRPGPCRWPQVQEERRPSGVCFPAPRCADSSLLGLGVPELVEGHCDQVLAAERCVGHSVGASVRGLDGGQRCQRGADACGDLGRSESERDLAGLDVLCQRILAIQSAKQKGGSWERAEAIILTCTAGTLM